MNRIGQFEARHLSNLAHAYALIGYVPEFDDGSDRFDHIAMKAVKVTKEVTPQNISNLVWAYATVNKPHAALFWPVILFNLTAWIDSRHKHSPTQCGHKRYCSHQSYKTVREDSQSPSRI